MLKTQDRIAAHTEVKPFSLIDETLVARLLLILALAGGAYLRIWGINAMGYNTDEAVYAGQAAAIAGVPGLKDIFPIFRAHPLLFQALLALVYKVQFSDLAGRLLSAALGIGTILLVYGLGKSLYGKVAGAISAVFLALMPYHVIVSRQVLLDGPMVFFATLTLLLLALFAKTKRPEWLYATGAAMGLTFLSKETSLVLIGAIYAFLALAPETKVRVRDLVISTGLMALVVAPFPITLLLAGGTTSGKNYLAWQLFRRPNHDWSFYGTYVPAALGIGLVLVALAGLIYLWRDRSWRETLLLAWIVVPVAFFQLWPVKGFQYLLPIAPAVAVLGGRALGKLITRASGLSLTAVWFEFPGMQLVSWLLVGVVSFNLATLSWQRIQPEISTSFLAGTGGVPGGREAGTWIRENVPDHARFITIGPSMANIVQFYGEHRAYGLAVSPNPLRRNPSYTPVDNPDLEIRNSDIQYLVWDSFSAGRSSFFADKLLGYVNKYNGRAVHTETITVKDPTGQAVEQPVIIIYEVHP
jgi:asparagine N-glycosylation enzyme membrane subunit Stt3